MGRGAWTAKVRGGWRDRRNILRHKNHPKPELLATRPNEFWSWDITKLHGPKQWTYFYLYVIIDVFSRYAVSWMVAHAESSALATKLIEETCERQRIARDTLGLRHHPTLSRCLRGTALANALNVQPVLVSRHCLELPSELTSGVRNRISRPAPPGRAYPRRSLMRRDYLSYKVGAP
jgi:hypothetical protein